jgi:hypothetical protein
MMKYVRFALCEVWKPLTSAVDDMTKRRKNANNAENNWKQIPTYVNIALFRCDVYSQQLDVV